MWRDVVLLVSFYAGLSLATIAATYGLVATGQRYLLPLDSSVLE